MRLSRVNALLVDLLTVLLFAWLVALPAYFYPKLWTLITAGQTPSRQLHRFEALVDGLTLGGVLYGFLLWALYLFCLHRSKAVPAAKKAAWHGFLLFGSLLAMPIFWYLYMWRPSGQAATNIPNGAA
jgi:hypothetical protein